MKTNKPEARPSELAPNLFSTNVNSASCRCIHSFGRRRLRLSSKYFSCSDYLQNCSDNFAGISRERFDESPRAKEQTLPALSRVDDVVCSEVVRRSARKIICPRGCSGIVEPYYTGLFAELRLINITLCFPNEFDAPH